MIINYSYYEPLFHNGLPYFLISCFGSGLCSACGGSSRKANHSCLALSVTLLLPGSIINQVLLKWLLTIIVYDQPFLIINPCQEEIDPCPEALNDGWSVVSNEFRSSILISVGCSMLRLCKAYTADMGRGRDTPCRSFLTSLDLSCMTVSLISISPLLQIPLVLPRTMSVACPLSVSGCDCGSCGVFCRYYIGISKGIIIMI